MKVDFEELKHKFSGIPIVPERQIFAYFREKEGDIKLTTLRWRMYHLRQQGLVRRVARGQYSFGKRSQFKPTISHALKRIFNEFGKNLPYTNKCVWETRWLLPLMEFQPVANMIILEVEKEAFGKAFSIYGGKVRTAFLEPSREEMEKYVLAQDETLIIKRFLFRAPVQRIEGFAIPRLEKILVDLLIDKKIFMAFQGKELERIYRTALSNFNIDFTVLRGYAQRRGNANEVVEYIAGIKDLPEEARLGLGVRS